MGHVFFVSVQATFLYTKFESLFHRSEDIAMSEIDTIPRHQITIWDSINLLCYQSFLFEKNS